MREQKELDEETRYEMFDRNEASLSYTMSLGQSRHITCTLPVCLESAESQRDSTKFSFVRLVILFSKSV